MQYAEAAWPRVKSLDLKSGDQGFRKTGVALGSPEFNSSVMLVNTQHVSWDS